MPQNDGMPVGPMSGGFFPVCISYNMLLNVCIIILYSRMHQ